MQDWNLEVQCEEKCCTAQWGLDGEAAGFDLIEGNHSLFATPCDFRENQPLSMIALLMANEAHHTPNMPSQEESHCRVLITLFSPFDQSDQRIKGPQSHHPNVNSTSPMDWEKVQEQHWNDPSTIADSKQQKKRRKKRKKKRRKRRRKMKKKRKKRKIDSCKAFLLISGFLKFLFLRITSFLINPCSIFELWICFFCSIFILAKENKKQRSKLFYFRSVLNKFLLFVWKTHTKFISDQI